MKKKFHRGYLFFGVFLAIVAYGLTLLLYPEWRYSWGLLLTLLVIVISGVVSFLAGVRQAFETSTDTSSVNSKNNVITNTVDHHSSGLEVNAPIHGPQVGGITINIPVSTESRSPNLSSDSPSIMKDNEAPKIGWEYRDSKLLHIYFEKCAEYDPEIFKDITDNEVNVRDYLISSGLAYLENGRAFLTGEGVLLCGQRKIIPRDQYHIHVKFKQDSGQESLHEELFGSVLYLYYELSERLKPLYQRRMGSPDVRDESGAEKLFFDYPEKVISEALTNFLVHRDYSVDDIGFITIYPDKVEFTNPGLSEFSPQELLTSIAPVRPIYKRNPRLIEAMNKSRLNEREGGGILRIRTELVNNKSVFSDGSPGLTIENDSRHQRFTLTIFKRKLIVQAESAFTTLQSPFMGPSLPPQGIIGRKDIITKIGNLLALDTMGAVNIPPVVLRGMGGTGKTTIAIALVNQRKIRYIFPEGVLWASLGPKPNMRFILNEWGRALGIDLWKETDELSCHQLLKTVLRDRHMFIVIDDVWETSGVSLLSIGGPYCRTLFTTREVPIANDLATRERTIRIDVLQPDAARNLLLKLAPELAKVNKKTVMRLCEKLEFLPLGLSLAGRMLANESDISMRLNRLLNELVDRREVRLQLTQSEGRPGVIEGKPISLQAILGMSVERLSKQDQERFAMLSVFGSEPHTWEIKAASAVWECTAEDAEETLSHLIQRGLVEPKNNRYWMHALLADYAAELLEEKGL
ncbi:MAG: hypothetical protein HYZ21_10320 [Chloroflexi bacterium]|nr:hypothetical protein [Chloroflexota bacterium]